MGGKKKSKQKFLENNTKETSTFTNYSVPARNLRKSDLGGVIFGCKHSTINECLSNNIFGLPAAHYSYIKNIKEGLALFLFNYSDRKLHGVFEAVSPGQMNINRYAWVEDDYAYTSYPAQVRVCIRHQCHPLTENQFGPVIEKNYYEKQHFYFELDNDQTKKLIELFTSSYVYPSGVSSSSMNATRVSFPLSSFPVPVPVKRQTSGPTYASAVSSQQPTGTWRSLFKSESSFEIKDEGDKVVERNNDEWTENNSNFANENNWEESAEWGKTWESDVVPDKPLNTWEESGTAVNEAEWVQTNQDKDEMLPLNTWEESAVNEAEYVETNELPSSSSQPLDDKNRQVSSSSESEVEENHEEDKSLPPSTNIESLVAKLMQEVEELKGSHLKHITSINLLEQELDKSKLENQQLKTRVEVLESGSQSVVVDPLELDSEKKLLSKHHGKISNSVYLFGGYDGTTWLPCLDSYHPSYDIKIPFHHMNLVKTYASGATMNGELYHFGGGKVESFNPTFNQWVLRPPLIWDNIYIAGATVNNKLFVVGGSKGTQCFSEVEYLDLNVGKWLPTHSMNSKRLAPAAAESNNALYVTGGFDGESYSSSVERLDPREGKWSKLADMNKRKGSHSMVVLNEKLYTLGGYDGEKYIQTTECFDTRMGSWVEIEPMNVSRGYFGAFVMGEYLYAIGGMEENTKVLDIVECYKEESGWEVVNVKAIGRRSHFGAIVL